MSLERDCDVGRASDYFVEYIRIQHPYNLLIEGESTEAVRASERLTSDSRSNPSDQAMIHRFVCPCVVSLIP